jgi:hypothetical protein
MDGDTGQSLIERVDQLPSEVHDRHADIWSRLNERNPTYRKYAVRYFLYVIHCHGRAKFFDQNKPLVLWSASLRMPALAQIAFAEWSGKETYLLEYRGTMDLIDLEKLCINTKHKIESRCGGLLQIRKVDLRRGLRMPEIMDMLSESVDFIHRTAYDFLVETETGQKILSTHNTPTSDGIIA